MLLVLSMELFCLNQIIFWDSKDLVPDDGSTKLVDTNFLGRLGRAICAIHSISEEMKCKKRLVVVLSEHVTQHVESITRFFY